MHLTLQNICAIISLSDAGFACTASCQAGGPNWVTVPAWDVVYYPQHLLGRYQENRDDHIDLRICVLHTKQSSVQDSVAWTSPNTVVLGETGEEASPPSAHITVWVAPPVFQTGTAFSQAVTACG